MIEEDKREFFIFCEKWEMKQLRRQNAEMSEFIRYLKASSTGYTMWEEVLKILQKKHGSERICDVLKETD